MSASGIVLGAIESGVTSGMNKKEAKKARKWSKKMYQRRYQYTMQDLKKAGLNPILAAGSASPGSVPSAAQARVSSNVAAAAQASTAKQMANQQIKNLRANEALTGRQSETELYKQESIDESTALTARQVALADQDLKIKSFAMPKHKLASEIEKTKYGKGLRYIERAIGTAGAIFGGKGLIPK